MNNNNTSISKCDSCGGNLVFSPNHKALHCFNCGNNTEIVITKNFEKHPLDYTISQININNWKNNNSVYECKNCGGKVVLNNSEMSSTCPYCNSAIVTKIDSAPGLLPDQIIPFQFDKAKVKELFKRGIRKKWFLPNKFKKNIPDSEITAFYGSAFSFDTDIFVRYRGELYENERDSQGNSYRKSVSVSGSLNKKIRDMMIESTNQMTQDQFNKIAPFNLVGAIDYQDSFIRGFATEYYNNPVLQSFDILKNNIYNQLDGEIVRKHFCDGVEYLNKDVSYSNERYSHLLFPVYKFNYNYKNKKYCTFVNGQTGKVGGGVPRSGAKIALFVIGIVLIVSSFIWGPFLLGLLSMIFH